MQLNIVQILEFLDILDPNGRHTIASEAPFGNAGGPKWEGGSTFEAHQRKIMIEDIQERQKRGSNVYYSVNRPCPIGKRTGLWGKNNIDDIIAIRALAFDIDFTCAKTVEIVQAMLSFFDNFLINELQPSLVISTGGGYQLIYMLDQPWDIELFRPAKSETQEKANNIMINRRSWITTLAHEFEAHLRNMIPKDLPIKVDNMSNVDRVMRLPGTVNYPKSEKLAKGQKPAIAEITTDYHHKTDIRKLRNLIPVIQVRRETTHTKTPFIPPKDTKWPPYRKALVCCEFIAEQGLADSNEWYTINVMLPLIGAIHDPDDNNRITEAEAEELFMLAVSGGARYGSIGRGPGYFGRQWRSHRPHLARNGTKSLGGLIFAAEQNGYKLPWKGVQMSAEEYEKMKEYEAERNEVTPELVALLFKYGSFVEA
jgi:hypothetical protein